MVDFILYSFLLSFMHCNEKHISLKQQLYKDDHWNPISYMNLLKTSSLIFTRLKYVRRSSVVSKKPFLCLTCHVLKYVRRSSVVSKKPFLCLTCHVHHVWNRNKRQIFRDISKIIFSVATNNPALLSLPWGTHY